MFVAVPYTGQMYFEYAQKTLMPLLTQVGFCNKGFGSVGKYGVAFARNALMQQALASNADYILWVDMDMILEQVGKEKTTNPNQALGAMLELMKQDPKIGAISGLYRVKKKDAEGNGNFHYAAWKKLAEPIKNKEGRIVAEYAPVESFTGNWVPVDAVGFGFILIRTEVAKKMTAPWFHYEMPGEPSEDFYFCNKMQQQTGATLWMCTDVKLKHLGAMAVSCDEQFAPTE